MKETYNDFAFNVLGFQLEAAESNSNGLADNLMEMLISMRNSAKENKDYAMADKIRNELTALKVQLKDSKDGTTWEYEG